MILTYLVDSATVKKKIGIQHNQKIQETKFHFLRWFLEFSYYPCNQLEILIMVYRSVK